MTTANGIAPMKQPFMPITRGEANHCFCAACGSVEEQAAKKFPRATEQRPTGWQPTGWSVRLVSGDNVPDGIAHVFMCPKCMQAGVDGPGSTAYYDKYDMQWSSSSRQWVPIAVANPPRRAEEAAQVPATQEEKEMTTNGAVEKTEKPGLKERAIGQAKDVGGALGLGLKLAAVDEVGDLLVDVWREFAKDNPMLLALLSDETGREFVKMTMAFGMQSMTVHTSLIPQSPFVKAAAELQMAASMEALAKPHMKSFRRLVGQMAVVGERMAEAQGGAIAETSAAEVVEDSIPKETRTIAAARAR